MANENLKPPVGTVTSTPAQDQIAAELATLIKQHRATPLEEPFYAAFADDYFEGIPLAFRLQVMNQGNCYQSSALLGLAWAPDCFICRGELTRLSRPGRPFGHGWVEKDGLVYDTTWRVQLAAAEYAALFAVRPELRLPASEFFARKAQTDPTPWRLYHRADYTSGRVAVPEATVRRAQALGTQLAADHAHPERAAMGRKLLHDLPPLPQQERSIP